MNKLQVRESKSLNEVLKEVNKQKRARIRKRYIKDITSNIPTQKIGKCVCGSLVVGSVLCNSANVEAMTLSNMGMTTEMLNSVVSEVVTDDELLDMQLQAYKDRCIEVEPEKTVEEIAWEKEQDYCLSLPRNVFDGWGTKLGPAKSNSATRSFMSYTAVTSKASMQYKILRNEKAWTNTKTGLRMYEDRYCVAVGTKYGKAGDKIDLVMADGTVLKCIIGDIKSNHHTDETHMFQRWDGSVVELIMDSTYFSRDKVPTELRQTVKTIVNLKNTEF